MIAIAAVSNDGKIGHNDDMLWNLPEDFKWYKKNTTGNIVVVGAKTFSVLPPAALKNRRHVVISKSGDINIPEGADVKRFASVDAALNYVNGFKTKKVFLAGGSQIYHEMLQYCDEAYITWVNGEFPEANKDFPFMKILHEFILEEKAVLEGEQNGLSFKTSKYRRIETPN